MTVSLNNPKLSCQLQAVGPVSFIADSQVICGKIKDVTGSSVAVTEKTCEDCKGVEFGQVNRLIELVRQAKKKRSNAKKESGSPIGDKRPKLDIIDKVQGVLGAFHRLKAKGLTNPDSYCDKKEISERVVCCQSCTTRPSCPYCGCRLKAKRFLATESCPTPETYPHLKRFPPRDYWKVCRETTSVIIASANDPCLNETIDNLFANATGKIEVIVVLDGWYVKVDSRARVVMNGEHLGKKVSCNRGAEVAIGEYLLIVDAHCTMSYGWDTILKCTCDDRTLVATAIKPLDPDKLPNLEIKKSAEDSIGYCHVYLNKDLHEKWDTTKKPTKPVEELMALTGCGWMIRSDYYHKLGGYNERLGPYGRDGPGWALNVWLNKDYPGKLLLRSDVVCGHMFGTNQDDKLYPAKVIGQREYYKIMMDTYGEERINWLVNRFAPVPSWDNKQKKSSKEKEKITNGARNT